MTAVSSHRLDGFEPDNLLAFLALLGLLRALEADDQQRPEQEKARPRAAWDLATPPLRPLLFLTVALTREEVTERAARGVRMLAEAHAFDGRKDLSYTREDCRKLLEAEARRARFDARGTIDVLAALMSDAAIKDAKEIKDDKKKPIDPTPLCLLSGGGHQEFLERLFRVPRHFVPQPWAKGRKLIAELDYIRETLFEPWHYRDNFTSSFRWDPAEDVRYALMAGDPTDGAYKSGTQHGANRLAAVGLAALTLVPETRAGRVRPRIIGGIASAEGFSFAWPIWRDPATLRAVRALLTHPRLREPTALAHLGVDHVVEARRISVARLKNFTRARPVLNDQAAE